ncbi:uncharacterized protein LY89DRAFT_728492 [Mollisia scopiformis]|uniref:CENP-V/GFA domain-containing protein n=1 Tax=Mollisia scopiformis TaxID=149040 RepID=A0A194XQ99_MOLSC|nr:uncharacterized protein LY89DRAFT_728492 [Mollisia scopiformis]KUJ22336.1 hypothetical protein LY89DRAFT_728492 [Mollisia scopiformis]
MAGSGNSAFSYVTNTEGQCICASCHWTSSMLPAQTNLVECCCNSCKTHGGAPFAVSLWFPKHDFFITGPVKCFSHIGGSGGQNMVHRYWCDTCGSTIGHECEIEKERIHVSAASLTTQNHPKLLLKPAAIWLEDEKFPFHKTSGTPPKFPAPAPLVTGSFPATLPAAAAGKSVLVPAGFVFPRFPYQP